MCGKKQQKWLSSKCISNCGWDINRTAGAMCTQLCLLVCHTELFSPSIAGKGHLYSRPINI